MLKLNSVYNLDCLSGLKQIEADSVDVCVTSPPYWGQRGDHGIGSEADPRDYIKNLSTILFEVMRVLKPSGLLWLNIGDSYNTPINWSFEDHVHSTLGADKKGLAVTNSAYTKNRGSRRAFIDKEEHWLQYGNLLMIPNRVVMALCDAGNFFRGEVIWAKRKAMPEGRCRRPHRKHECIYIIAKSERHAFRVKPPVPSVWDILPDMNRTPHTSTFPLDLPIKCIQASGVTTGLVLDPFMGSGTTALAAKLLGFDYIGFELNQENVKSAQERINAVAGALIESPAEPDAESSKTRIENQSKLSQSLLAMGLFEG
jgi:DNA modification methylase